MKDLVVVEYISDEDYQLGAFKVKSTTTDQEFILEPDDEQYVLYFDSELFCWMVDLADNLRWDINQKEWVSE